MGNDSIKYDNSLQQRVVEQLVENWAYDAKKHWASYHDAFYIEPDEIILDIVQAMLSEDKNAVANLKDKPWFKSVNILEDILKTFEPSDFIAFGGATSNQNETYYKDKHHYVRDAVFAFSNAQRDKAHDIKSMVRQHIPELKREQRMAQYRKAKHDNQRDVIHRAGQNKVAVANLFSRTRAQNIAAQKATEKATKAPEDILEQDVNDVGGGLEQRHQQPEAAKAKHGDEDLRRTNSIPIRTSSKKPQG